MKQHETIRRMLAFSSNHPRRLGPTMSRRQFLKAAGASLAVMSCVSNGDSDELTLVQSADVRRSSEGVLRTDLRVRFASNQIGGRQVFTRTYEGTIPGPILRVRPGDTVQLRLFNDLPHEEEMEVTDVNMPHGFNVTNLHYHGFHVSSNCSANGMTCGDNVLIELEPGESQLYEFTIPSNHPDGTYWYHPHKHGSAAVQFMGGMAGALLIDGATDEFLSDQGVKLEQVFVLQQIRVNAAGEVEFIDAGSFLAPAIFTVNGEVQPTINIRPGEVQRWRFIHGGMSEHFPLELRDASGNLQTFHQLAFDGITAANLQPTPRLFLTSGNRVDVLVKLDAPGVYQLIKPALAQGLPTDPVPEALMATVVVAGVPDNTPIPQGPFPTPLPSIMTQEINSGPRTVTFAMDFRFNPPLFLVDGKLFDPNRVDQRLTLGAVEEWTVLNTSPADHPFHIHQNPFLVTSISGDPLAQPTVTLPVWMDTVNVPRATGFGRPGSIPGRVTFRTRIEDFDGLFVLHCHILDHEDMGMMQLIEAVRGGTTA